MEKIDAITISGKISFGEAKNSLLLLRDYIPKIDSIDIEKLNKGGDR